MGHLEGTIEAVSDNGRANFVFLTGARERREFYPGNSFCGALIQVEGSNAITIAIVRF